MAVVVVIKLYGYFYKYPSVKQEKTTNNNNNNIPRFKDSQTTWYAFTLLKFYAYMLLYGLSTLQCDFNMIRDMESLIEIEQSLTTANMQKEPIFREKKNGKGNRKG